jgi:hypothetical protein
MSGNRWVYGNLALSQSADSAAPVYARRSTSNCRSGDLEALMLAAAAAYQGINVQYEVQAHPLRLQSRVSPVTLFSRTGSVLPPSRQYISLDLEDYQ